MGYSPLMSYLLSSFGGSEAFGRAASLLSEALGFGVSATAVQRNTEGVGERIPDNPHSMISAQRGQKPCELMVVEVDGTISPQILEKQGIRGRESLKQPTEWKECTWWSSRRCKGEKKLIDGRGPAMASTSSSRPMRVGRPWPWGNTLPKR